MIKRCYKCKHVIGGEICKILIEKKAKTIRVIIHSQAENCPEYEEAKSRKASQ